MSRMSHLRTGVTCNNKQQALDTTSVKDVQTQHYAWPVHGVDTVKPNFPCAMLAAWVMPG